MGADRGEQTAAGQLAERGVGVGVPDERRQMRLVRHLAAERDGEAQGLAGGLAQPGGEQRGGGGAPRRAQGSGYVVGPFRRCPARRSRRRDRVRRRRRTRRTRRRSGAQHVALPQQGAGLDEPQRQPLGLEPEVARPGASSSVSGRSTARSSSSTAGAAVRARRGRPPRGASRHRGRRRRESRRSGRRTRGWRRAARRARRRRTPGRPGRRPRRCSRDHAQQFGAVGAVAAARRRRRRRARTAGRRRCGW